MPNKIPRNPPFRSFASFLVVSLTTFINKSDSSSDLTIFIISLISLFEIVVDFAKSEGWVLDPNAYILLWIAASDADATAVNLNVIKKLLANGLSTFPIKDNPDFRNGPKSLPKNPPYCPILCKLVFDHFILGDEPFLKALRSFKTCVLVNNSLCGQLFSSLEPPATFD